LLNEAAVAVDREAVVDLVAAAAVLSAAVDLVGVAVAASEVEEDLAAVDSEAVADSAVLTPTARAAGCAPA